MAMRHNAVNKMTIRLIKDINTLHSYTVTISRLRMLKKVNIGKILILKGRKQIKLDIKLSLRET